LKQEYKSVLAPYIVTIDEERDRGAYALRDVRCLRYLVSPRLEFFVDEEGA
jgi:hypothetical protein